MSLLALALTACSDHRLNYGTKDTGDTAADTGRTDTGPDTDTDTVWDTDDRDTDETDTEEPTPAVCERILVYSTVSGAGRARGRFAGLESDPVLARWTVDVRERADEGPLTAALLEDYSQVWLFGTDPALDTALDFDEVRAIRDFVDVGGGLFVAGEHEDTEESYADDVALVAELYGVSFEGSHREGDDGALATVTAVDATLLAGVSQLPGFASVAELGVTDSAVQVAGKLGGMAALAYRDDARIAFDRSWEGWTDSWRGTGDQPTLVGDVATFLEWCAP